MAEHNSTIHRTLTQPVLFRHILEDARRGKTPGFPLLPQVCLGSVVTYRCDEWSTQGLVTPVITLEGYRQEGFSIQGHPWLSCETLSPQETGELVLW